MHLIPAGLGIHNHGDHEGHEGHAHEEEQLSNEEVVWRASVALLGAYFIFIIEKTILMFGFNHSHDDAMLVALNGTSEEEQHRDREFNNNRQNSGDLMKKCNEVPGPSSLDTTNSIPVNNSTTSNSDDNITVKRDLFERPWYKRCTSLCWIIFIGDGLHNFTDGIAIGAAFSLSTSAGISTAIAILLHELGQEI
eukprot:Pgem_evm1s2141